MKNFGFIKVAAISPCVKVGDVTYNRDQIELLLNSALKDNIRIAVFPELCLTGYTCADLFYQDLLYDKLDETLIYLDNYSRNNNIAFALGAPLRYGGALYNCALYFDNGLKGIVPKCYLPNYNEFYERRWFTSGLNMNAEITIGSGPDKIVTHLSPKQIFCSFGTNIGIEVCEDLWVPNPPSTNLSMAGADVILNLSASPESIGKYGYVRSLVSQQSARCRGAYVYSSAGWGESSTDLVFSGTCLIAEEGNILAESPRFAVTDGMAVADIDIEKLRNDRRKYSTFAEGMNNEEREQYKVIDCGSEALYTEFDVKHRYITPHPFVDPDPTRMAMRLEEILSMQARGLATRLHAINCRSAVIGISGGLDSTLALLVAIRAFDMLGLPHKGIIGVTMPGFGTTGRTKSNADKLMELLGVTQLEIPINRAVELHFKDIKHDPALHDATYENSQARERTQILMDLANQTGGIVIGTGDLSELALGWCTYNGDHMSMYAVNTSIPKTMARYLVEAYANTDASPECAEVLRDIIDTPISPELLPSTPQGAISQKTEDLVGPYELHDFFLYYILRFGFSPRKIYNLALRAFDGVYEPAIIKHWLKTFYRRFFNQQFKRSCMPDGVKVGSVCLSPRGDWRMPSDASSALWLEEVESL